MSEFRFKEFSIRQSPKVFKVGTDAILCGILSDVSHSKNGLEVGTGTGIISLMIAQRNPDLSLTAIDIDKAAYELAKENFRNSKFHSRINAQRISLQEFKTEDNRDLIISNPPFFNKTDLAHKTLPVARSQINLDLNDLFNYTKKNLSENGTLQFIYPYSSLSEIENKVKKQGLFLHKIVKIRGNYTTEFVRAFFIIGKNQVPTQVKEFTIEKTRGEFTDEYKALTKDFHPMF